MTHFTEFSYDEEKIQKLIFQASEYSRVIIEARNFPKFNGTDGLKFYAI